MERQCRSMGLLLPDRDRQRQRLSTVLIENSVTALTLMLGKLLLFSLFSITVLSAVQTLFRLPSIQ